MAEIQPVILHLPVYGDYKKSRLNYLSVKLIMIIIQALLKSYPQIKGLPQIIQKFIYMFFCSYPKTICAI
ncbi:MAG: hypothetical protein CVV41_08410 [Candidatus Riflebacteria bacterium HGW-Riflebacteria-1]|jgi:hypothetical protein|nr:MAG: hypothetical protein CVV41_08410 [Candidatus Riflebacteria bacterium HGW-Riflebacteria-1]